MITIMRNLITSIVFICASLTSYAQKYPTLYAVMNASEKGSDKSITGGILVSIVDIPESSEKQLMLVFSETNIITVPIVKSEEFYESLPGQSKKVFCHHIKCVGLEAKGIREVETWTFYKDPQAFAEEKPLAIWISNGGMILEGTEIKVVKAP